MKCSLAHVMEGHASAVYSLMVVENQQILYSGGADGILGSWDCALGTPRAFSIKVGEAIFSTLELPAENLMLIGQSKGGMHVVDKAAKVEKRHLQYHKLGIFDIVAHPTESFIYAAGGDGILSVMDSGDYRLLFSIPLSDSKLRKILLHPSGKAMLVAGSSGTIRVLETLYYNELSNVLAHKGGVYALGWMGESQLVSGGRDGHIRIWDFDGENLEEQEALPAHRMAIYDIDFHPSGKYFATASRDKTVKIWDVNDLRNPLRIQREGPTGHTHSVNKVRWVNGGQNLASAGDDKKIYIWNFTP